MHQRERAFVCLFVCSNMCECVRGCMCPVYLHFCVCGRPGGRLCFVAAYVCKCIKHTEQRGPEAKNKNAAL